MMTRYAKISFWVVMFGLLALPSYISAASITEKRAAIGEDCVASGGNSTAMGYKSTASGTASTAMGFYTTASNTGSTAMGESTLASGYASTAMGMLTQASGYFSFAGGYHMHLTDTADQTFVWGHSNFAQSISIANAFLIFPAGTKGKVGIGTANPREELEIYGDYPYVIFDGHSTSDARQIGVNDYGLAVYNSDDDRCDMVINNVGNVGIGATTVYYKLQVNGDAAGTSWTNLSSKEYKEDIRKVDGTVHPMMLAKLMDMDLTTYTYKKEYGGDGDTKLGFIAEEMPEEVLSKDGKGVDLYELLTLTIGAMKAQQKENEVLKAKLAEVITRLEALETNLW